MYNINLFIINTTGFNEEILNILYWITIYLGILVITSKNPIFSVLCLILIFLNISLDLLLLKFNFLGLSYLLVYMGAISILFLFVLMMINTRIYELVNSIRSSSFLALLLSNITYHSIYNVLYNNKLYDINFVLSNFWDGNIVEIIDIAAIGDILYTNYFIWLIMISIILLLSMVGAIYISLV